jgi:hypothetical protein
MGFNLRHLPELEVLLERRKKYETDEDFLRAVVGKSDSIAGPNKSVEYLDSIYEKIKNKEKKEEIEKSGEDE